MKELEQKQGSRRKLEGVRNKKQQIMFSDKWRRQENSEEKKTTNQVF